MNSLMQHAVEFLAAQSLHLLILFALVLAATMAMRHKSAHLRYLLWLLVIAKCLVPPVHTISLSLLPTLTPSVKQVSSEAPSSQTAKVNTPELQQTHVESYISIPQPAEPLLPQPSDPAIPQTRPAPIAAGEPTLWERLTLVSSEKWIAGVWLSGIVLFCLVIAGKAIRFHLYLRKHRTVLTQETHPAIFEFLSAALPDKKPLRIYQLSRPGQPFVWGLPRGAVYLPENFAAVNDPHKQQSILMHEAGHILRMDPLVNFLQVIAQGVFWFHPLVWIANRMIRAEREKCCDEFAVATLKTAPRHYCTAIVEALMTAQPVRPAIPTLAVAGPVKNIEDRIKTLLTPGKIFRRRPTVVALIVITLLAAIIVPTTIALTHKVTPPDYSLSGSVVDTDGKPIAGAIVFDDGYGPEPYQKGITDAAGKFEYKSWNEEHNVAVKADDYTPQSMTFTTWPFDNSKKLNFTLHRATEADPAALPEGATEAMLLPEYLESQTVLSLKTGQFILTKQANEAKEPFLCYSFALSSGENFRKFTAANIPENRIGVNAGNLDTGGGGFGDEGRSLWAIQKMQELPDFRMNRNTWEASEDIWSTDGVFIHPPLDGNWPYIAAFKGDDGTYGIFEITKVEDRKIHIRFKTLTDKPLLQSETETKPQISISMRAISIPNDDSQLQSLFDTAGIHMPQFAMSVSQDGDSTGVSNKLTYGQSALLTAKDVEQMLKAVQSNPDSKLLIAPEPVVWSGEAATIQTSSAQTVPQGQKQFSLHITPSLMSEGILSEFEIISSDNIEIKDNQIEETTLLKSKVLIPQDKTLLILGPDFYQEFLDKQTSGTKPQRRLLILLKTREYDDTNPAPSSSPNIMSPSMGGMGGGGMGGGSVGSMANNMGGGMGGGGTGGGMGGGMGGMGGGGKSGVLSSKTSPFTATLPNGVTVELVGLCEHPSQGKQWWKPDGTPRNERPYDNCGCKAFPKTDQRAYEIALKLEGSAEAVADVHVGWRIPQAASSNTGNVTKDGASTLPNVWASAFVCSSEEQTIMPQVGVDFGAWEEVSRQSVQENGVSSGSGITWFTPTEKNGKAYIHLICGKPENAIRVTAVDTNGNTHIAGTRTSRKQERIEIEAYLRIPLSQIAEFRLWQRPIQWITFKNVSLRPGVKTDVEIVSEKPEVGRQESEVRSQQTEGNSENAELRTQNTAFTAVLPNGVTVELVGICEHPSEGKQWWKPDGQITQEIPYAKFGWNSSWTQTGREFAVRVMNAENCSVASKSDRYNDDQWVDQRSPLNAEGKPIANLKAFLGVFETDQYQGDVSFGVACGPWEKVEEWRQIDWTVEHADKISFTSRKSVIFTGPQEYMDGFIVSVTHTFEDKAARLILVDKKGQHHVQKHSREGEGQNLLKNSYYVQGIKRSDIDKFIFETRDYEWITFKNVALRPGVKTEVEVVAEKSEVKSQERDNRINPLAELSIPPDASPRVANALKTIADTMNAVEVTGRDRLERLAGLFDRINESCDDLQGKNGTEIPNVPEWGQLPSRLVDILELLHKIEETAEGCRGLAMADQKELLEQHWQTLKDHYNILCLFLKPKQQAITEG